MATRIPLREYAARRIALIKPSALGDIVHSLPILTALRRRYPHAHITWVVNRAYEPLLNGHPDLNATLTFDRGAMRRGWRHGLNDYYHFFTSLRRQAFDLVIDLQGLFRTGLMTFASGAPRRVGLSTAREGAGWFYTDTIQVPDYQAMHAVDRYWLVAEALGMGDHPKSFHVPIARTSADWAEQILLNYPRPFLMVAPGARWETKRWRPEHFAALTQKAQENFGGTSIFLGGKDEIPHSSAIVSKLTGPVCDVTGQTTLPQLAALLARADAVIANDSGPLHLAAALGRPVVAPYTCTRVQLHGPYGGKGVGIATAVPCAGSYIKHCDKMICMPDLTPDRLWPALQGVLLAWQRNRLSA